MKKLTSSLILAVFTVLCIGGVAQAQDFTVPIIVDGDPYTLTVSVNTDTISVTSNSDIVTVGTVTPLLTAAREAAAQGLDEFKSNAVTIEYDDLFRNNEEHIGKMVWFVGEVLEFKDQTCLLCKEKEYMVRVAVTQDQYGYRDDPIWVDYSGSDRFLDDDVITLWGAVEGLKTYTSVLGGAITIPKISAVDIVLGEVENPGATQTANINAQSTTTGIAANSAANLRAGPGTAYAVVGGTQTGQLLDIVARNSDASWFELATGEWIAAFLVDNLEAPTALPVAEDIPEPPVPTANQPSDEIEASSSSSPSIYAIGDEIQGKGWRFNVKEVHKRKAVYFYDDPHVAMNNWVVVIMDAVNEQGGTDDFANNVKPYLIDDAGNIYRQDFKASRYAGWQYGGLSSTYTDVDPGNLVRIAMAFDIPESVNNLMLSTDLPAWIKLGNYAEMELEE